MAIRQYVGARYVPRFTGLYNATQIYDALDVVDNGSGTSYIAKKTVPAGTPLTDTDYWFIYGASSGAIIQLQNDVADLQAADVTLADAIAKIPENRKYVLIGDSFGCGIQGGGLAWVDGWIDYFSGLFPGRVFYYDPAGDPAFEGVSAFTTTSPKNFIGQLNYVFENKLGTTKAEDITDVVVLGGTNELSGVTENDIAYAIDTFAARSRELFPNADIKVGIWGLNGRYMVNNSNIFKGYKLGAQRNGCAFLQDAVILGCNPTYDSGYGHFNASGYAKYNPYIAQMILTDHCWYTYYYSYTLEFGPNGSVPSGTFNYAFVFECCPIGIRFKLLDIDRQSGPFIKLGNKVTYISGFNEGIFYFPEGCHIYFPFDFSYALINADFYYAKNDGIYAPGSKGYCYIDQSSTRYRVSCRSAYPFFATGSFQTDPTYDSFIAIDTVPSIIPMYTGYNI